MYPQRSVMTCGLATALEPPHFNPRTRVGCNRARMAGYGRFHASFNPRTRVGCDCACPADACAKCCFNPRTRVGCDPVDNIPLICSAEFQSTHPRGVRPDWRKMSLVPLTGFNPRTRVGCDNETLIIRMMNYTFQSTHPRGVRLFPALSARPH